MVVVSRWVSPGMMVPEFEQGHEKTTSWTSQQTIFKPSLLAYPTSFTDTRQQDMTKEVQERMVRQILGETFV